MRYSNKKPYGVHALLLMRRRKEKMKANSLNTMHGAVKGSTLEQQKFEPTEITLSLRKNVQRPYLQQFSLFLWSDKPADENLVVYKNFKIL